MRTECINHQYGFDKPMPVTRLMDHVSNSMKVYFFIIVSLINIFSLNLECQVPTQRYGRRPFGVGFLMAGFDVCSLDYFIEFKYFLFSRRKVHIYIKHVHQQIIIHANRWQ
jgi:20S proteasome alpha/beta subunit